MLTFGGQFGQGPAVGAAG